MVQSHREIPEGLAILRGHGKKTSSKPGAICPPSGPDIFPILHKTLENEGEPEECKENKVFGIGTWIRDPWIMDYIHYILCTFYYFISV